MKFLKGKEAPIKYPVSKESHFVKTSDEWKIHILRRKPAMQLVKQPLLLIHGFGQNRFTWEPPASSFSTWFSSRGIDIWMVELRGSGLSKKKSAKMNWTFETFLTEDLPHSIKYIQEKTGQKKLFLCGHSLGGTLIYCYTPFHQGNVKGFISLGGPVFYGRDAFYMKLGGIYANLTEVFTGRPAIEYAPYFPLPEMGWLALLGYPLFNTPLEKIIPLHPWHRKNVKLHRLSFRIARGFEKVSPLLASQLMQWISRDGLFSFDNKINYLKYISKIIVPCLFVAGNYDRLAPPKSIKPAFDMVSSKDKKFILLNKKKYKVNWGHLDLTMGKYCEEILFPLLLKWIKDHSF